MQPYRQFSLQCTGLHRGLLPGHHCGSDDVSRYNSIFLRTTLDGQLTRISAAYVQGRNAFQSNDQTARLGRYNFGFMWGAVAALFIAMVLLCAGGAASGSRSGGNRGGGRFSRNRKSTRSRGSFIDKETAVDGDRSSFVRGT